MDGPSRLAVGDRGSAVGPLRATVATGRGDRAAVAAGCLASLGFAQDAVVALGELGDAEVAAQVVGQAKQGAIDHRAGELGYLGIGDAVDLAERAVERLRDVVQRVEVD